MLVEQRRKLVDRRGEVKVQTRAAPTKFTSKTPRTNIGLLQNNISELVDTLIRAHYNRKQTI